MSKDKKTKTKNSPTIISLFIVFGLLLIGCGIFFIFKLSDNKSKVTDYSIPSDYSYEVPDIEEYFNENSMVLEVIPVSKSDDTLTEKDAIEIIKDRGFTDYEITTSYSIDGAYYDELEVSSTSSDLHPIYQTYYMTEKNGLWVISVIDGEITASPSYYNIEHSDKTPILASESKEIISYDSSTNSFYRTIPNDNVLDVRVVDIIDAKTLESIDLEG